MPHANAMSTSSLVLIMACKPEMIWGLSDFNEELVIA